ncbi:MAG: adenylate/guanylate cyclase domain-containing protein [Actinomycetota bacterium]
MRKLFQHLVIYAAVNAFIVAVWVLIGGGSMEQLQQVSQSPNEAMSLGFWPIWPILAWGVFLVIHAGSVFSDVLFGGGARRRRRAAREAAKGARDLAKEVISAIDSTHTRRRHREAPLSSPSPGRGSGPERKWVTVMFCDIADSTSHNERLGDDEWHRVLAHIRNVVRSSLTQRGGTEVGTQGDGMLSRFTSPAEAVLCAIDIQAELGQAREASDFVPELRIGVHAGDAVEDEGDLIGRVINLASRVTDAAAPGEILVTEPVADQLVGKLELEDKGLRELKGLSQPRHLLAVKWSDQT